MNSKSQMTTYKKFSDLKRRAEKNGWTVYVSARLDMEQPIDGPTVAKRRRRDFTDDLVNFQNLCKLNKLFFTQAIIEKPFIDGPGKFQLIGFIDNQEDFTKMWRLSAQKHLTNQTICS